MSAISYKKYENMSRRELINSLTRAENKLENLQERFKNEIKNQVELVSFIKAKIRVSLDKPKAIPYEQSTAYKKISEIEKTMSEAEKQAIYNEVDTQIAQGFSNDEL